MFDGVLNTSVLLIRYIFVICEPELWTENIAFVLTLDKTTDSKNWADNFLMSVIIFWGFIATKKKTVCTDYTLRTHTKVSTKTVCTDYTLRLHTKVSTKIACSDYTLRVHTKVSTKIACTDNTLTVHTKVSTKTVCSDYTLWVHRKQILTTIIPPKVSVRFILL